MSDYKIKHNPYKIVSMFEECIADYTGAPYALSIDSCTNALFLTCKYFEVNTYVMFYLMIFITHVVIGKSKYVKYFF